MNKVSEIKQPEAEELDVQRPENIFGAIASAASHVKVLGKSERNKFDGYDFVSIDKFLALVNPICSQQGLFPIISQRTVEFYENTNSKGGKSTWARFFYDVTLYHSSGESLGPTNIMVSVPMNGAQATGSAQSYALKQFFRATLMIPTGDKDDADLIPTEAHQVQEQRPSGPPKEAVEGAADSLKGAETLDQLKAIWSELPKPVQSVAAVIQAKDGRKAELDKAAEQKPAQNSEEFLGDHIPHQG